MVESWYQFPFTEALLCITALKDLHGSAVDYSTVEGQLLRALGWARNYAAQDPITLSRTDLASSGTFGAGIQGMSVQGAGGRLVWVGEGALAVRADEHGRRDLYQRLVAGRDILQPLQTAESYLTSIY